MPSCTGSTGVAQLAGGARGAPARRPRAAAQPEDADHGLADDVSTMPPWLLDHLRAASRAPVERLRVELLAAAAARTPTSCAGARRAAGGAGSRAPDRDGGATGAAARAPDPGRASASRRRSSSLGSSPSSSSRSCASRCRGERLGLAAAAVESEHEIARRRSRSGCTRSARAAPRPARHRTGSESPRSALHHGEPAASPSHSRLTGGQEPRTSSLDRLAAPQRQRVAVAALGGEA